MSTSEESSRSACDPVDLPPRFDFSRVSWEGLERALIEALNQESYWNQRWVAVEAEMNRRRPELSDSETD